MLNNNNKAVINRLYRKMLKQNKLRNRVTILAIILTTFMFTAIFTMGFSLAENLNEMLLRQQGTKSSIYLEIIIGDGEKWLLQRNCEIQYTEDTSYL